MGLHDLTEHAVSCDGGNILQSWTPRTINAEFYIWYTCCPLAYTAFAPSGSEKTCSWSGDPHVYTFDGKRHDPVRGSPDSIGTGSTFWMVKGDSVSIQGYYQGHQTL